MSFSIVDHGGLDSDRPGRTTYISSFFSRDRGESTIKSHATPHILGRIYRGYKKRGSWYHHSVVVTVVILWGTTLVRR